MYKKLLIILLSLLLTISLFINYREYKIINDKPKIETIVKVDTIRKTEVDTIYIPQEKIVYNEVKVIDTIKVNSDTILLVEQKEYKDTISTIWVSGVNPTIDSIEYRIPRDTIFTYKEVTNTIYPKESFWKNRFCVTAGVNCGYSPIYNNFDVVVGLGVNIRLF